MRTSAGRPSRHPFQSLRRTQSAPVTSQSSTSHSNPLLRSRRFRVYPTAQQRSLLRQWMGVCRWTYNQAAEPFNKRTVPANLSALQKAFVNNDNYGDDQQWVKDVPASLRLAAVADVVKALTAYRAKQQQNQTGFHLKYRAVRDPVQSITVSKYNWNHHRSDSKYSSVFSTAALRGGRHYRELLRDGLPHDSRLLRDRQRRWFLCVPFDQPCLPPPPPSVHPSSQRVAAIDPGVRTFLTTYDLQGEVHEWGKGDMQRLYRLAVHVDTLQSKASKAKHRQRHRIRKAIARVHRRIHNLVDDVHRKACAWLCKSYDHIILPQFNSSEMVKRATRRIRSKTVRSMLHWSHYRFRQRLLCKAESTADVRVRLVTEEWTSKTCGMCGNLHHRLGGSKHFRCPSCGWTCDRDVNGARNIMLKTITSTHLPAPIATSLYMGGVLVA